MKKLRWGLIGCGDISRKRVAPALHNLDNCELIAVNRSQFNLAEGFAKEFGAKKWYKDWHELLNDDEIDAVYVSTPVYLHSQIATAAANAGKHILCEKPMALTLDECDAMIQTAGQHNVELGIAYYKHLYPSVKRIKEIITSGEIGKVIHVQINAFEFFNKLPGEDRYWLLQKDKAGGGPMFDFGCHRIEILINLLGSVKSIHGFLKNVLFEREVEDTAAAVLEFESGANAVLNVSHAAFEAQDTLDIFGSKGSIHVPALNSGKFLLKTNAGNSVEELPPHVNFHLPLIKDFTDAVIEGRKPLVDGAIGREVNRVLEMIYSRKE